MLHCYFATVWIRNSGGIATTSTLPTLHHWICQGWDCKNVGSILQQEPHCLDEQQRQCNRLMKDKAKWTPPCYSATPLQTRREHLISELRATLYTATMLKTEKKAQTKWTPPCYSPTPLLTRHEHLISERRQKSWEVDADYVMAKWSLFKRGWSELSLWMFECMFECLFAAKTRSKTICVLKLD